MCMLADGYETPFTPALASTNSAAYAAVLTHQSGTNEPVLIRCGASKGTRAAPASILSAINTTYPFGLSSIRSKSDRSPVSDLPSADSPAEESDGQQLTEKYA